MCNDKCELLDGSNSVSDIQDYFKYIIKKHETLTDHPLIRTYVNKNFIFLKTLNSEILYIKVRSTDQSSKPLQIILINVILVIN